MYVLLQSLVHFVRICLEYVKQRCKIKTKKIHVSELYFTCCKSYLLARCDAAWIKENSSELLKDTFNVLTAHHEAYFLN
jgi:hypothetical protein